MQIAHLSELERQNLQASKYHLCPYKMPSLEKTHATIILVDLRRMKSVYKNVDQCLITSALKQKFDTIIKN